MQYSKADMQLAVVHFLQTTRFSFCKPHFSFGLSETLSFPHLSFPPPRAILFIPLSFFLLAPPITLKVEASVAQNCRLDARVSEAVNAIDSRMNASALKIWTMELGLVKFF